MLIKLTAKEMAALALALQERPGRFLSAVAQDVLKIMDEQLENHEKIVLHQGQLIRLRGNGVRVAFKKSVDINCECLVLAVYGDAALIETVDGPVIAYIQNLEAVEDAKV